MTLDWQTVIAAAIVVLAAGALLRRASRMFRGKKTPGCDSCPANAQARRIKELPLVQLEQREQQSRHH